MCIAWRLQAPEFHKQAGTKTTYRVLNNEWSYRLLNKPSSVRQHENETVVMFDSKSLPVLV